jgi:hypothetical protein
MPGTSVMPAYRPGEMLRRRMMMAVPGPQFGGPPPQGPPQRPGYNQRAKNQMVGRASGVIAPHLEPGEQVLTGLRVQTGPSNNWVFLSAYVRLFQRRYFMLVTDRRVYLCGVSYWTARPSKVKVITDRAGVQVSGYDPVALFPSFRFSYPDRGEMKTMKFRSYGLWLQELYHMMTLLGQQPPPGYPGGQQYPQQPGYGQQIPQQPGQPPQPGQGQQYPPQPGSQPGQW